MTFAVHCVAACIFYNLLPASSKLNHKLAPIVIPIEVCNGLTNQRISIVQGITHAIIVGAQVLIPVHMPSNGTEVLGIASSKDIIDFNSIFDGEAFAKSLRAIYHIYWCARRHLPQAEIWCNPDSEFDPVVKSLQTWRAVETVRSTRSHSHWRSLSGLRSPSHSIAMGPSIFSEFASSINGWGVLDRGCTMFSLEVKEDGPVWDLFWEIDSSLKFSRSVVATSESISEGIRRGKNVPSIRMQINENDKPNGKTYETSWTVLHLRIETDWQLHCEKWMNLRDGIHRDNCANNSKTIHNTLLSEGIPRLSNIYVSSGLSLDELLLPEYGLEGLFEHFSIFTKESTISGTRLFEQRPREWWAAVETELSISASMFVGNSVSTFSAYILQSRRKLGRAGWHYNGGGIPLSDAGILSFHRSRAVETFPRRLKWVFTIHEGSSLLSKSFSNQLKVAVLSAKAKTSLVPICVTTSSPHSKLVKWLVDHGVRILYHQPTWIGPIQTAVSKHMQSSVMANLSGREKSHLSTDQGAMIGTFLRIDIPILGIRDEFVLYTDVDVLFRGPVRWRNVLPSAKLFNLTMERNDFARGKFAFGCPNSLGLPTFFSVSSESEMKMNSNLMNAGVMLLNMRNLREAHERFSNFITEKAARTGDLNWDSGPGDQGALKDFFSISTGGKRQVQASLLPFELNWKSYWPIRQNSSIVHFHGPKCESDILPYFRDGTVHVQQFKNLLRACRLTGNCLKMCAEFQSYLEKS